VKLPRDQVRDSQLAGLAVIAVSLAGANREISVEVIDLYPEGRKRPATDMALADRFHDFGREITRR